MCALSVEKIEAINFSKLDGLLPVVVVDAIDNTILMLGFMNREALERSLSEKRLVFFSRSRQELWLKGETSGNYLKLKQMDLDCDQDTLLAYVENDGPTCHSGGRSCFESQTERLGVQLNYLSKLESIIEERLLAADSSSYVYRALAAEPTFLAAKVIEEAVETAQACKKEGTERSISEAADLLFHLMLLLKQQGLGLTEVCQELEARSAKIQSKEALVEEKSTLV